MVFIRYHQEAACDRKLPSLRKEFPIYRKNTMNESGSNSQLSTCADVSCCEPASAGQSVTVAANLAEDQQLADLAKAIAHPVRVHILRILGQQNACICADVVNDLGLPQSTVSQHLKVLHSVGLVHVSDMGRSRQYCVNHNGLRLLRSLIVNL